MPQSELLCGGAAAAMVMRYWGAREVYADAFAPLVNRKAGGIETGALVAELRRRSWIAAARAGTSDDIARELGRGRPVIALIAVRGGRFHYIVVVSATRSSVVLHDPARAPFRVLDASTFDAAWAKSGRWMLVLLPPGGRVFGEASHASPDPGRPNSDLTPCGGSVAEAVKAAAGGDRAGARQRLEAAVTRCPSDAAAWRELAGVDALDARWADAASHARRSLADDPHDEYAWRTLATAEYVQHHDAAALDAWNQVGEPRLDLVHVDGLSRMRYGVADDAIGLATGALVSASALRLAERRLESIPSTASAHVSFHPLQNGRAQVDAAVVERPVAPLTYPDWLATGLRAASEREASAAFANLTGGGELVSVSWRWWEHRPAIAGSFSAPAPRRFGGVWRVAVSRESETFRLKPEATMATTTTSTTTMATTTLATTTSATTFEETRVHAGFGAQRWMSSVVRLDAGVGIDRWTAAKRTASLEGGIDVRSPGARLVLAAAGAAFAGSLAPFATWSADARWRSRAVPVGRVWLAGGGFAYASGAAPEMLWPGADTGHARAVLLRAHPLLEDGIITGTVFGRHLAHASAELQQWFRAGKWPLSIAPAAFVDVARARDGLSSADSRAHADVGVGVRLAILGSGALRVDVAHGTRDGRTALSIGWTTD